MLLLFWITVKTLQIFSRLFQGFWLCSLWWTLVITSFNWWAKGTILCLLYSYLQNQSTLTQIFLQLNWGLQSTFSIPSYKINEFLLKSSLNWTEVDRVTSTLCTSLCELYVSCVKLQVDLFVEVSLAFLSKLLQYLANVLPVLENYLQNL